MGNFEKLSVLVIGVIIVMILVVAIYTWTGDPEEPGTPVAVIPTEDVGGSSTGLSATGLSATGAGDVQPWGQFDLDVKPVGTDTVMVNDITTRKTEDKVESVETVKTEEELSTTGTAVGKVEETYEIQGNDTLGLISQKFYGTTKYWPKIAERNSLVPERLRVGKTIYIPVIDDAQMSKGSSTATAKVATHAGGAKPGSLYKVRGGETIQEIARAAYGRMERWPEIWVENLEVLKDPAHLRAGIELRLPE